jgi:hypothetical protein
LDALTKDMSSKAILVGSKSTIVVVIDEGVLEGNQVKDVGKLSSASAQRV